MERILLVEDDAQITASLSAFLQSEGFSVETATGETQARQLVEQTAPGLLLVDVQLAEGSGFGVCAYARSRGLPVIFLTASGDESSVVLGLDMGADDYIAKPFRPRELVSRIRSVLRRYGKEKTLVPLGGVVVDTEKGRVTRDGRDVYLSALEYRLLLVFLSHRGKVLSRSQLLEEIWDAAGDFVNDNTLTVYIKRLREKIEEDPADPQIIRTVRGIWKNTEVRRTALWLLLATAVCSVAAALLYPICGLLTLGLGAVCGTIWYGSTRRRYRELERMSRDIDRILHGQEQQMLPQQEEGELAILRSEIGKMTVRLRENAQRQQEERVRLADAMADISHQLRTPLTAMRLTLSLLEQEELTPQRRLALMRELKKLTGRMEWLVEALLKMAQLDAGTVVFHPQDTTAAELVRRAAEPLEVPMEVRSIRFTAQAGEERLTCDVPWSTEALGNILKNCMEHAASWVQVTARETAIFTEITVQDDGPGFDPEELPRLFQRFYRGKNAGENNFGIGLSLSRQVLAQQNGTVQAENVLTGGARFILRWYKGTI